MRYYKRKNFLQLKPGVIYSNNYVGFCVKLETIIDKNGNACDFFYKRLTIIEFECFVDLLENQKDSIENGTSYPMNSLQERDGFFDDSRVFIVFERSDLEQLEMYICHAKSI